MAPWQIYSSVVPVNLRWQKCQSLCEIGPTIEFWKWLGILLSLWSIHQPCDNNGGPLSLDDSSEGGSWINRPFEGGFWDHLRNFCDYSFHFKPNVRLNVIKRSQIQSVCIGANLHKAKTKVIFYAKGHGQMKAINCKYLGIHPD